MTDAERLAAIDAIRTAKARYWRGVDTADGTLVRSMLARACELDYRGCCTDPKTGHDFFPAMNIVLKGRDNWVADAFEKAGIVSVHQGHHSEIDVTGPDTATGIWAFTDHFHYPAGSPLTRMTGHGYYHDTYVREDGGWKLATTRIVRLRVEAA